MQITLKGLSGLFPGGPLVDNHVETKSSLDPGYSRQYAPVRLALSLQRQSLLPVTIFALMSCTLVFACAVLSLRNLGFVDAFVGHSIPLTIWPAHILFAGLPLTGELYAHPTPLLLGWQETALLGGAFLSIFLLYLIALRCLPQRIGLRYIVITTALIGVLYILVPTMTSADVFSYIAYARYGVFYHQNMLTAVPMLFPNDIITPFVQWRGQPSAYGPTWAFLSYSLQWVIGLFSPQSIVGMVLALRSLGLVMHLLSSWLIWVIIGHLQHHSGYISPRKRLLATLAFAWNPLLLFEACVNGHNDASLLVFVLLALLMLVRRRRTTPIDYVLAAFLLALATCLKLNIVLLLPALLLYMWTQRPRRVRVLLAVLLTYIGTIALLYAPFWSNGAVLEILSVNPGTIRAVNTPADFLSHLYNGFSAAFGAPVQASIGSPSEHIMHSLFTYLFVVACALLGLKTLLTPAMINRLPRLIQWMAMIWLLYCVLTPWFWPWYMCVFFGLYALIEGTSDDKHTSYGLLQSSLVPRLLTFTMLVLNCFTVVAATQSTLPGLPGFQWAFLRGLWAWFPLLIYYWQVRHQQLRKRTANALEQVIPLLLEEQQPERSRSEITV